MTNTTIFSPERLRSLFQPRSIVLSVLRKNQPGPGTFTIYCMMGTLRDLYIT